ncbi:MAG: twin-arginine translocase TatA/TatE family subunit [Balneolaceae bacterium]|jgi:sec-independent protein translocase protein TatA|nr:twin-arginine translocase TatA/TatE family subunit [Balneolaceae bacterium]MDR9446127.1 twin-arginine translocase TatA/TatE family subunit [Balneolaceae bacterium]
MNIGGWEYLIIFLIILLLFGAKKIPDLARGLGQGIQEFRKASDEVKREIEQGKKDAEEAASTTSSTSNDEKTTSSS